MSAADIMLDIFVAGIVLWLLMNAMLAWRLFRPLLNPERRSLRAS